MRRSGAERVYRGVHDAPDFTDDDTWPEPDLHLVSDDRPAPPGLEADALPAGWADWIYAEAGARGCPPDYIAASLIAAASAWIGNARHIRVTPTWTEIQHLWFANIGMPSTGKTPGQRPFIDASRNLEKDAEPVWEAARAEHVILVAGAKALAEAWQDAVKKAAKTGEQLPRRPPGADEPPAPPRPRVLVMDTSVEELQQILADQPRGLLFLRDELSGWLGSHDRYGGKGGDRAFYLEAWNGASFVVDRVKHQGQPVRIERAALAILGSMQPDKLREALSGADDGLAARLVYVWPDPAPINALATEPPVQAGIRRDKLLAAAGRLAALEMNGDPAGSLAPRIIPLGLSGVVLFDELRREAMEAARSSRGLASGWHGKTPGRALRLALVFELLAWAMTDRAEPHEVSPEAMARAGGYLDYLGGMLDRVTAGLAVTGAEADAATIGREIIASRCTALNEREWYQRRSWAWMRDTQRRTAALNALADANWIRPVRQGDQGRPRGDWVVSPRLQGRML